jgi:serine protease AprX
MKKLSAFFLLSIVVLLTAILYADNAKRDDDRISANLKERLAKSAPGERLPVIVVYKEGVPAAEQKLRHVSPQPAKFIYRTIAAVATSLTPLEIDAAVRDPEIEHIELDAKLYLASNKTRSSFGVQALRSQFNFTGDGDGIKNNYSVSDVVVGVIDTGVDITHPDLANKVLYWKDYINGRTTPYDDNGHGTMVSGIAVGTGKLTAKNAGVAPQAALVAWKLFDANGTADTSDAIAAIEDAIAKKSSFHIRILNMSFSDDRSSSGKDALSKVCNNAVSAGIVVLVAAGNSGPGERTIGSPGAASKVVTVGAGADLGERGFYLADFSGRGPTADGRVKPDLWGPGVQVIAPNNHKKYSKADGTSFSTPFVAGVVALMLQANPDLTPKKIKHILKNTAVRWGPGNQNSDAGAGRLQAYEAVTAAAGMIENLKPPDVPELLFDKTSVDPGQSNVEAFDVTSTKFPIAITAIVSNYPSGQVSLELTGPDGDIVASRFQISRQQTLRFTPKVPGTYSIRVESRGSDAADYLLDVSSDLIN